MSATIVKRKPKLLVVDDEPDNLDLLYRTFRREFNVLKAESGIDALEILAQEGEVAVIISDQRMPEMKGTEFLSKTVPEFPDTIRIILTGFTDVEDLVEAINSGQVYKYITKPWDPYELKAVVERATETYELLKQRSEQLDLAKAQTTLLEKIVQIAQECFSIEDCLNSLVKALSQRFQVDNCILQQVKNNQLIATQGHFSITETLKNWLDQDPLVSEVISSQKLQKWYACCSESVALYESAKLQSHILVPIVYRHHVLALLSLQWKQSYTLSEEELKCLQLSVQQIALVLHSF
jgi:CheY-like chemotaxis protein